MSRRFSIFLILVIAVGIRLYRADAPFDGFHGFNEAWYAIIAQNYERGSLLYPVSYEGKVDYNIPPLFSWAEYAVFRAAGRGELQARAVSVFFSATLVFFVILLGERMYGGRAGLAAGALTAAMPMAVVVGHNAQVDTMFTALLVAFLYVYVLMRQEAERRWLWLAAGLLLGAATLTKQPAALGLAVAALWEVAGRRNWKFLDDKFIGVCAVAFFAVAAFYLPHILLHPGEMFGAQTGGALNLAERPDRAVANMLLSETWWGLSPAVALLALWALPYELVRLRREASLPAIGFLAYGAMFVFLHKHSYYSLPALVFAAIFAGRLWAVGQASNLSIDKFVGQPSSLTKEKFAVGQASSLSKEYLKGVLLASVVCLALLTSLLLLCRVKYGWHVFQRFGSTLEARGVRRVDIITSDALYGSYGPLLRYYAPGSRVLNISHLEFDKSGEARLNYARGIVLLFHATHPFRIPPRMRMDAGVDIMGLEMFGFAVYTRHTQSKPNPHLLGSSSFAVKRVGPPWEFGVRRLGTREAVKFVYLPPVYRLRMEGGQLKIVMEK